MPFCPACRLEYRPGFVACSDCGVPLLDELPPEPRRPRSGSASDVLVAAVDAPRARSVLPFSGESSERVRRRPHGLGEDDLLDDVDFALAHGDADLAEDLLSSLDDGDEDQDRDRKSR